MSSASASASASVSVDPSSSSSSASVSQSIAATPTAAGTSAAPSNAATPRPTGSSSVSSAPTPRSPTASKPASATARRPPSGSVGANPGALAAAAAIEASEAAVPSSSAAPALHDPALDDSRYATDVDESSVSTVRVPRLDDLIIHRIAQIYSYYPILDHIPLEYVPSVIALVDPKAIAFTDACQFIQAEAFWEKWAKATFQSNVHDLRDHGNSWKRYSLERYIECQLASFHPSKGLITEEKLLEEISAARPWIFKLTIEQFPSHADLSICLAECPNLGELRVKFGAKRLGMDYDPDLFGANSGDLWHLTKFIAKTRSLHTLVLKENVLTDGAFKCLLGGLKRNDTILRLDLSHNELTDSAFDSAFFEWLGSPACVIAQLNLADNGLGELTAQRLSEALRRNQSLRSVSLALNFISSRGASKLFQTLETGNRTLESLALSSCGLNSECLAAVCSLIERSKWLKQLDVSGNQLVNEASEADLLSALQANGSIKEIKVRRIGLSAAAEQQIDTEMMKRHAGIKRSNRKNYESGFDQMM